MAWNPVNGKCIANDDLTELRFAFIMKIGYGKGQSKSKIDYLLSALRAAEKPEKA